MWRLVGSLLLLPLVAVLAFAPVSWIAVILIAGSVTAVYELLKNYKIAAFDIIASCAFVVFFYGFIYFKTSPYALYAAVTVFIFYLFMQSILNYGVFKFSHICTIFFSVGLITLCYSSLLRLLLIYEHRYFVLLTVFITISTDVFAYITGRILGKHQLAPKVSPKKTIEGSAGGLVLCVLTVLGYGYLLQSCFSVIVNYPMLLLYGAVGCIVAQIGDLSFSVIKRECGIKDFGKLIPGHGGVLDRFDSLLFVLPLTELLLRVLPAFFI